MICITNNGEIDLKALFLIGASTKRDDDSMIGMFGSGNKYAIATLLRKKIDFKIYTGNRLVNITTKPVTLRDQKFDVIHIDGQQTSLTTEMGPGWETWFALREFISNAIDEGGHIVEQVSGINPEPGKTKIYIEENQEIKRIIDNVEQYFCFNEEPFETVTTPDYGTVSVFEHDKEGFAIYRKGIRCNRENTDKSFFRYDFSKIDINESRVFEHSYEPLERIAEYLLITENKETIQKFITDYSRYHDFNNARFDYANSIPSKAWIDVIQDHRIIAESLSKIYSLPAEDRMNTIILPDDLVNVLKRYYPNDIEVIGDSKINYLEADATEEQKEIIETSIMNLKQVGINITQEKVKTVRFKHKETMGAFLKEGDQILISVDYISNHREMEIMLLEEYIHFLGYSHGTRELDEFLIECIYDLLSYRNPKGLFKC